MKRKTDKFKDKVAFITGAGSGIGYGLASELAKRSVSIVISDINPARINKVERELRQYNSNILAIVLDVTDHKAVKDAIEETVEEFGRLDYLFNNAGIGIGGEARDISVKEWRKVIDINLFGVIYGIDAGYPIMVKHGSGHIVNIGSIEGLIPFPGHIPYTTSKYAVVGLSHSLRIESKPLGIEVSVVCPGFIDTAIFSDAEMVNLNRDKALSAIDFLKPMTVDKCAKIILKGVERNNATIVITGAAKLMWFLHRINPNLTFWIMKWLGRSISNVRENKEIRIKTK